MAQILEERTVAAEEESSNSISLSKLFAALQRSQSWISNYATPRLGPSVSPYDFTERLHRRLRGRVSDQSPDTEVDEALKTTVRYLVKEQCRVEFERAKRFVPEEEGSEVPDPGGLSWVQEFERNNDSRVALELLRSLDPEMLDWIKKIYAFNSEEDARAELAKHLGIRRNTLNQRLSRKFRNLRSQLWRRQYNGQ
jgi:hypothetical protein